MQRRDKNEILKLINTILKAHNTLEVLLKQFRMKEVVDLLTQCQECAIWVGNRIEEFEKEQGAKAVSLLEIYCEQLYQLSQNTSKKRNTGLLKKLNNVLLQAKNEIEEQLPLDPLKVVFMPYKASMWDCMETIWEAAIEDKSCNTYVVPVPYYEKNQKREIERECYEGELFPDYVEITSYNDFSLENEMPDIIYIHNPYDENNYVTSVHPDYYSANLKKYTDMLVYVPYFFLGAGSLPETHLSLPAYQYVDKIIVQDEKKAECLEKYVPREKLLVMGAPKVERLLKLNEKRNEIIANRIPLEWKNKIKGKKVFLFNISISGILQNSDTAIDKIRYVLSKFENRDDVVLLWRPHPLIEATLKSMRIGMYQEYMEVKNSFLKSGKGIWDETADAGISAAIADAYVGEGTSSLVHYFGIAGKSILYTNWEIQEEKTEEERSALLTCDCFMEKEYIYFTPRMKDLEHRLYRLDIASGELSLDTLMPGVANNPIGWWSPYLDIACIKDKIVFAAYNSGETYIYDRNTKRAMKLLLSEQCEMMAFDETISYGNKLILKPKCYPAIVRLDIDTYEVTEYKECILPFRRENAMESMAYVVREKLLYMAAIMESRMLIFNMDDGTYEIKEIGDYQFGYVTMVYDGKYYWLSAWKKEVIIRWDEITGETVEFPYTLEKEEYGEINGAMLLDYNDELIIFHTCEKEVMIMNKQSGKIHKKFFDLPQNQNGKEILGKEDLGYSFVKKLDENRIITFRHYDYSFIIWNLTTGEENIYPLRMSYEQMTEIERMRIDSKKLHKGTPYFINETIVGLNEFIDYVLNKDELIEVNAKKAYENCFVDTIESTGVRIHTWMKECVEKEMDNK